VPEEWHWGRVHRARLGTPLSFLPILGKRLLALDEGFPGDDYTVSPSRPLEFRGRLYAFVGATSRFVCDLAKPDEAWFAHSSGPSADVASTFYANLARPWHRFEHFRSALWRPEEVPDPVERLVLAPN
jgi:acyl-homoserine lactone acylase PvdQ